MVTFFLYNPLLIILIFHLISSSVFYCLEVLLGDFCYIII